MLLYYTLSFAKSRHFVSLSVSLNMQTISCRIDRPSIEKATKKQRTTGKRITLADTACSGLKLVINSQSASWVYAYRKRGYLDGGRRNPQRTKSSSHARFPLRGAIQTCTGPAHYRTATSQKHGCG